MAQGDIFGFGAHTRLHAAIAIGGVVTDEIGEVAVEVATAYIGVGQEESIALRQRKFIKILLHRVGRIAVADGKHTKNLGAATEDNRCSKH